MFINLKNAGAFACLVLLLNACSDTPPSPPTVAPPPPPPAVDLSFESAASAIDLGQSVMLTWNAVNATGCSASGAWSGTKASTGSESVEPGMLGTMIYRLSCTGAGAPDTEQVTVVVTDPFVEAHAEFLRLRALEKKTLETP